MKHENKIDPRKLVARLQQESTALLQREIIAPMLPHGKVRTRIGKMVHEFRVKERFVGWGRFQACNEREVQVLGEALPWERGEYLVLFPALRVLLLWPDSHARAEGIWWAIPYNESDARQRFGFAAEPLPIFLCDPTNGADRFERVIARVEGKRLWFEGPDLRADPAHAEWLREAVEQTEEQENFLSGLSSTERLALLYSQLQQIEREVRSGSAQQSEQRDKHAELRQQPRHNQRAWIAQEAQQNQLEGRLRHALAKADATLHSYREVYATNGSVQQVLVEWSQQGQTRRYNSYIDPRLTVVSSGICLSGYDSDFDLTSLVDVMGDAPW